MDSDLPQPDVGWTRVEKGKSYSYLTPPNTKGKRMTVSRTDHIARLMALGYSEDVKRFLIFSNKKLSSQENSSSDTLEPLAGKNCYTRSPVISRQTSSLSDSIEEQQQEREKNVHFGMASDSPATSPAVMEDEITVIDYVGDKKSI